MEVLARPLCEYEWPLVAVEVLGDIANYFNRRAFVATSKAPVNCATAPDALNESHSYVCQSEILLLGSGKVTAE